MITEKELVKILKKATKAAGSQRKWALDKGLSPSYVNDIIRGKRGFGKDILAAMEYEKVKGFKKIGDN